MTPEKENGTETGTDGQGKRDSDCCRQKGRGPE